MKQKFLKNYLKSFSIIAAVMAILVSVAAQGFHADVLAVDCASASDCQQQIANLNQQNAQAQSSLNGLQAQAGSFQDAINRLQAQINVMQGQIDTNQSQQRAVEQQIANNEAELARERFVLGQTIKAVYVDGQPTTLEMLASSRNLSDFIDKEEYRTSVQQQIQTTLQKINTLQKQLQDQEAQIAQLIRSLQDQQNQLDASRNQQAQMLSYNQDQQAAYNAKIQANKQALSQLYAKQAAIIAASFGGGLHYGGTGNYPYANAVCLNGSGNCGAYSESPYNWGYLPYQPYDPAGWQYRNCTSYAFWRLAQTTGIVLTWASFPHVYNSGGRIGQSIPDFEAMGYRVDQDPTGQAVLAVNTGGNFGHIMYVEGVVNGKVVVSQYNAAGDGLYSTGTLDPNSYVWSYIRFIHIR